MQKIGLFFTSVTVGTLLFAACSSAPAPEVAKPAPQAAPAETAASVSAAEPAVPASYKDVKFPEFKYVAPVPGEFRVQLAEGISGYIVSDRSLPLVNLTIYFEESNIPAAIRDEAASGMVGSMLRRGAGGGPQGAVGH